MHLISKSDLFATRSKVNRGSSFEQVWQGLVYRSFIPRLKVTSCLLLEKKIFKVLLYMGVADHVTHPLRTNFCSISPWRPPVIWFQLAKQFQRRCRLKMLTFLFKKVIVQEDHFLIDNMTTTYTLKHIDQGQKN